MSKIVDILDWKIYACYRGDGSARSPLYVRRPGPATGLEPFGAHGLWKLGVGGWEGEALP
jgi:hypothetical protein